eukprot:s79_g38.t1
MQVPTVPLRAFSPRPCDCLQHQSLLHRLQQVWSSWNLEEHVLPLPRDPQLRSFEDIGSWPSTTLLNRRGCSTIQVPDMASTT